MVQALCRRNGTSPYSRSGSTKAELAAYRSRAARELQIVAVRRLDRTEEMTFTETERTVVNRRVEGLLESAKIAPSAPTQRNILPLWGHKPIA